MKDTKNRLPYLGLMVGIILLFFPQSSTEHNHLSHQLLLLFPVIVLSIVMLSKMQLPSSISATSYTKTLLTSFLMVLMLLHLLPGTLDSMQHHQSQSPTLKHPCCQPQLSIQPALIVVHFVSTPIELIDQEVPSSLPVNSVESTHNKSPPSPFA